MQDLADLERRIAAALQRIGDGIESLASTTAPQPEIAATPGQGDQIRQLEADLAAERRANADLRDRIAELEAAAPATPAPALPVDEDAAALHARIEKMTAQLDVQGLEMHRMRKTVVQLRENLRGLRRAQAANLADPEQINRAMMAELEAVRVTRLSEVAEMDEILSELTPLIKEERADA